ncbi:MAG: PTS system nitrogen regulatory IIA component [Planctomycetota bacterium]
MAQDPTQGILPCPMSYWKQFKPKSCSVDLKASQKEGILTEIVNNMVKSGLLEDGLSESALRTLVEREELASTGVGMTVAIPHVKLPGLTKVVCTLSVHKEGVEWTASDGEPVHILFTVLRPERAGDEHDPTQHLEMMSWIARLSREEDFRRFAKVAKTKTELVDLLKEMSAV